MTRVRVTKPGLLTTVQDLGRCGCAHLGVSTGGAADALSLRMANTLVGNRENSPALEMTLLGAALAFEADAVVAITGAMAECIVTTPDGGRELAPLWEPFLLRAGERLDCGATTEGARLYLAIAGGFEVPRVLGSASTFLPGRLGGIEGRALRAGDTLEAGGEFGPPRGVHPRALDGLFAREVRVTPGPQRDWFDDAAFARFLASEYEVSGDSNRNGIRMKGAPVAPKEGRQLLTEGVSLGAIQAPGDGQPIILFVDQQTTGGYPKIANVIAADMHRVGQLKPRDVVRFHEVTVEEAVAALRAQERWLKEVLV
jgi:antagonist of KipI